MHTGTTEFQDALRRLCHVAKAAEMLEKSHWFSESMTTATQLAFLPDLKIIPSIYIY